MNINLKLKIYALILVAVLSFSYLVCTFLVTKDPDVKQASITEEPMAIEPSSQQEVEDKAAEQVEKLPEATENKSELPAQTLDSSTAAMDVKQDVESAKSEIKKNEESNTVKSASIKAAVNRSMERNRGDNYLLPWFGTVEKMFKIGTIAIVTDMETGITFRVKRTYGTNHADVETLAPDDTKALRKIAGGEWSWARRAVAVEINSQRAAASMNMMPHAGIEDAPANKKLEQRSGGYGPGYNLDAVKGNEMDGQICIHFYNSKTHDSDKVDEQHQEMVKRANEWMLK